MKKMKISVKKVLTVGTTEGQRRYLSFVMHVSFMPQRHHGIYAGGATSRQVAGQGTGNQQQQSRKRQRNWIAGRESIKLTRDQATHAEGSGNSQRHSDCDYQQ